MPNLYHILARWNTYSYEDGFYNEMYSKGVLDNSGFSTSENIYNKQKEFLPHTQTHNT